MHRRRQQECVSQWYVNQRPQLQRAQQCGLVIESCLALDDIRQDLQVTATVLVQVTASDAIR